MYLTEPELLNLVEKYVLAAWNSDRKILNHAANLLYLTSVCPYANLHQYEVCCDYRLKNIPVDVLYRIYIKVDTSEFGFRSFQIFLDYHTYILPNASNAYTYVPTRMDIVGIKCAATGSSHSVTLSFSISNHYDAFWRPTLGKVFIDESICYTRWD